MVSEEWWWSFTRRSFGRRRKLWHGSSSLEHAADILEHGLDPSRSSREWTPALRSRRGCIYLTTHRQLAIEYARRAGEQGAVFSVDTAALDPQLIVPDEDSKQPDFAVTVGIQEGILPAFSRGDFAEAIGYGDDPAETQEAIERFGLLCYRGAIPPEAIRLERTVRAGGSYVAPPPGLSTGKRPGRVRGLLFLRLRRNLSGLPRWPVNLEPQSPRIESFDLPGYLASQPAASSPLHGWAHWDRVATTGMEIARNTPGADSTIANLFGLIHDSCRENEGFDPAHGPRAAAFVVELWQAGLLPLREADRDLLAFACYHHADGQTSADPTVGACWDADRLDLGRVGIRPDPALLSTGYGRTLAKRSKIGRNDPCWCGSGVKSKRCHAA